MMLWQTQSPAPGKLVVDHETVVSVEESGVKGEEIEIWTLCKRCKTYKISMSSWSGKVNKPIEEKSPLRKHYPKLEPKRRSEIGRREILILLFVGLIRLKELEMRNKKTLPRKSRKNIANKLKNCEDFVAKKQGWTSKNWWIVHAAMVSCERLWRSWNIEQLWSVPVNPCRMRHGTWWVLQAFLNDHLLEKDHSSALFENSKELGIIFSRSETWQYRKYNGTGKGHETGTEESDVRWDHALSSASEIPTEMILDVLYKSKLQDSVQVQTVLALYDQEIVRNNGQPSYSRLKTSVRLHIDQATRIRNFRVQNEVVEIGAVTKS